LRSSNNGTIVNPHCPTLQFVSHIVERFAQRLACTALKGRASVIITREPMLAGTFTIMRPSARNAATRNKNAVSSGIFSITSLINSVPVPATRWCLVEYIVDEKPSLARCRASPKPSIQIAGRQLQNRNRVPALSPGLRRVRTMPMARRTGRLSDLKRSPRQCVANCIQMVRGSELEPLVALDRFGWKEFSNFCSSPLLILFIFIVRSIMKGRPALLFMNILTDVLTETPGTGTI